MFTEAIPWRIKVISTPDGPAPEPVRQAWVGVEMPAIKLPSNFLVWGVQTGMAIACLSNSSTEAADWFLENTPKDLQFLTFGADEIEVLRPD